MNGNKKQYMRSLSALILVFLILIVSGCVRIIESGGQPTATLAAATAPQSTSQLTLAPAPTAPPTTPYEYAITFTVPGNSTVQKYMQLSLCSRIEDAAAIFGSPYAIYGANGYAYKAIAGSDTTEAAIVYRFMSDDIGLEFIASALDGRILKKQVSSPIAFPKLVDDASKITAAENTPYSQLLTAAGANPYLWMSFIAPNAANDADCYEVCIWPDKSGQLVAVVQNNIVLRCEYQPNGIVLPAAAADSVTPRAPRYLEPDPKNSNDILKNYAVFKKFDTLSPGKSEADVRSKMGDPTWTDENNSMLTLTYDIADAAFATGKTTYAFTFDNTDKSLIAKSVTALPMGDDEILGRYAMQMLPGMSHDDIENFMGKPLITNQSMSVSGDLLNSYTYTGGRAAVSGVFPKNVDACLWNEVIVNDSEDEALTLYEEYVIPVKPAIPHKTSAPTPTLTFIPRPSITPKPTLPFKTLKPTLPFFTPTPTLPFFTYRPPSITFFIPILPTPTPIIIY